MVSILLFGSINHKALNPMVLGPPACWAPGFAFRNGPEPINGGEPRAISAGKTKTHPLKPIEAS